MPDPRHTLIIGAGILGLGVAWHLARSGERVRVLERDRVGAGASHAAAGMLAPTAEVEFHERELLAFALRSQAMWPDFAGALEADAGTSVELDRTGTLVVALDRDDDERIRRDHAYRQREGLAGTYVDGHGLREMEPLLSPSVVGGVVCPDDWNVSNRAVVRALVRACERHGVEVTEGCGVAQIEVRAGAVQGIETLDGASLTADRVVVAAGAWSRGIGGVVPAPIRPVRGQMLALRPRPGDATLRHVVRAPEAYLVPKADGRLVVGATSEERGFDAHQTAGGMLTLLRGAWETVPGVWEWDLIESWTGFRPGSRDNLPLLGPCSVDGLFYATGHYRNGIQQAPASVVGLVEAMQSGRVPPWMAPFSPDRFRRSGRAC